MLYARCVLFIVSVIVCSDATAQSERQSSCNTSLVLSAVQKTLPTSARKFSVADQSSAEGGYWLVAAVKGGVRGKRIDFGETGRTHIDFFVTLRNEFAIVRVRQRYVSAIDPKKPVTVASEEHEYFMGCDDYSMLRVSRAGGLTDEKYRREFEQLRLLVLANPLAKKS